MPRCICGKQTKFGFPGEKAVCCAVCKKDGMKDVVTKKCPCGKQSIFGFQGEKAICCTGCKEDGMTDLVHNRCLCGAKRPCFGFPGDKATRCLGCKEDGMEDVVSKRCLCGKIPLYGFIGKKAVCCAGCKEDGMQNIKNKRCLCGKIPSFGFSGGNPTHCLGCKEDGMENVKSKKCSCGKQSSFGFPGDQATCCVACKDDRMIDVRSRKCPGYGSVQCPTNYQIHAGRDYCLSCDPDDSRRLDKKRDEAAFFNFLDKHITITQQDYPVHFKCIDTNKTMGRIDGIIITKDIVVCLELDEDAHEAYDPSCEEARMHNVSAELKIAYPYHSIAWIRVNPHTKKNGKRDTSSRALKIRDKRHQEALDIIKNILQNPRDCIEYIGY
ncbi:hypothetical protein ATCVGM07011_776L [Acanthocystis turfacea Chlorella virus GM0701.1]|nr:hypothetical protein ATCVGM07011_776L [Acanthocystis turfacea Chlorella virus GM0701.1]